jgi:DegV family protein with EDD domain
VDTCAAAFGQGLLVWNTCKMRDAGLSLEALAAWVEENKNHVAHWFTVDDLVYLKRGGRVSAATAMLGTVLNIKPVLHMDDEGHLISKAKVRGRRAALTALLDKYDELAIDKTGEVFISHADCIEDAEFLKSSLSEKFGANVSLITPIGPVIGLHAGPGTIAVFFLGKER